METSQAAQGHYELREIADELELAQFSALLDLCFSVPEGNRFLEDFPVWDAAHPVRGVKRVGVFHSDAGLVSCAAARVTELKVSDPKVGDLTLPIALIGGVVTHPQLRGQGLASHCVSSLVEWVQEEGASLAMLWSPELAFYQKMGFKSFGEQLRVPVEQLFSKQEKSKEFQIHEGWNDEIYDHIKKREEGLVLSEKDRSWYAAHTHVSWFYAMDTQGDLVAYAALGRGIDLHGVIHEWGGDMTALREVFRHVHGRWNSKDSQNSNIELTLLGSKVLFDKYGVILKSVTGHSDPLCLVKLLNPALTQLLELPIWIWGLDAA